VYDELYTDDGIHHPFTRLLIEMNKVPGIKWIRYTSPHPKDITEDLIKVMSELEHVCEHVHLPLQSGDNELLKKMNRHYTAEHFLGLVRMIRKYMPRAGISTDVIVGFCGETEEQFQNTMKVALEAQFDLSYTSMYSERKQTYAGRFLKDDISKEEKNKRYHELNDLIRQSSLTNNQLYIGETWEVLIEKIEDGYASGKTRTNRTVRFPAAEGMQAGDFVHVLITGAREWVLEGGVEGTNGLKERFRILKKTPSAKKIKKGLMVLH
jgi:tRNA-2-methylthio-N6-dimethylallyladenosine synthase